MWDINHVIEYSRHPVACLLSSICQFIGNSMNKSSIAPRVWVLGIDFKRPHDITIIVGYGRAIIQVIKDRIEPNRAYTLSQVKKRSVENNKQPSWQPGLSFHYSIDSASKIHLMGGDLSPSLRNHMKTAVSIITVNQLQDLFDAADTHDNVRVSMVVIVKADIPITNDFKGSKYLVVDANKTAIVLSSWDSSRVFTTGTELFLYNVRLFQHMTTHRLQVCKTFNTEVNPLDSSCLPVDFIDPARL
jgi:hypothetical protein